MVATSTWSSNISAHRITQSIQAPRETTNSTIALDKNMPLGHRVSHAWLGTYLPSVRLSMTSCENQGLSVRNSRSVQRPYLHTRSKFCLMDDHAIFPRLKLR